MKNRWLLRAHPETGVCDECKLLEACKPWSPLYKATIGHIKEIGPKTEHISAATVVLISVLLSPWGIINPTPWRGKEISKKIKKGHISWGQLQKLAYIRKLEKRRKLTAGRQIKLRIRAIHRQSHCREERMDRVLSPWISSHGDLKTQLQAESPPKERCQRDRPISPCWRKLMVDEWNLKVGKGCLGQVILTRTGLKRGQSCCGTHLYKYGMNVHINLSSSLIYLLYFSPIYVQATNVFEFGCLPLQALVRQYVFVPRPASHQMGPEQARNWDPGVSLYSLQSNFFFFFFFRK